MSSHSHRHRDISNASRHSRASYVSGLHSAGARDPQSMDLARGRVRFNLPANSRIHEVPSANNASVHAKPPPSSERHREASVPRGSSESWAHNHAAPRYVPKSSTIGPEDSATAKFYSSSRHRPGRDVKHHSCGISYIGDLLGGMNLEGSQSNRDRGHTLKQGHISGRSRPDGGARSHPGIHVFAGSTRGNTIYEETAFGAPGPSTTSSQLARRTTANTISTARPRGPSTLGGINCSGNSVMGHSHAASIQCRGHISGSVSGNRGETSQIINIIIKNEPASPAPTPAPVPPSVIPVVYPYCYNTASSPYWYWN
jgi:hypothetical protein